MPFEGEGAAAHSPRDRAMQRSRCRGEAQLSSYTLQAYSENHQVAVGYEARSGGLFLHVFDLEKGGDPFVEANPGTIEELVAATRRYARLPVEIQAKLRFDRKSNEYVSGQSARLRKSWNPDRFFDRNVGTGRGFHVVEGETCTAYFDDMRRHFLDCIHAHDVALCAVYALSDQEIVNALAGLRYVSVLVDQDYRSDHCDYTPLLYHDGVPAGEGARIEIYRDEEDTNLARHHALNPLVFVPPPPEAGRGRRRYESFHTKFCVFGDLEANDYPDDIPDRFIIPRAVWIGSYNPTPTGDRSIQSAVLLREREVVLGFMSEYFALYRAAIDARRSQRKHSGHQRRTSTP